MAAFSPFFNLANRAAIAANNLGIFVRSLIGLDRQAAKFALNDFVAGKTFTVAITQRFWNPESMRNASFVLGTSLLTLINLYLHIINPR